MINLVNISKSYPNKSRVLKDIYINIAQRDFVSIQGKSGSGKSTLLNIIGLLDNYSEGEYYFKGKSISSMKRNYLAKIRNIELGFVFQSYNLITSSSVYDNVILPFYYGNGFISDKDKEYISYIFKKLDIEDLKNKNVDLLSGGEKQRVCIARALVKNASIVIADEPTGNLDPINKKIVIDIFKKLNNEGKTIIIVTHDNEVANMASTKYQLEGGFLYKHA